MQYVQVSDADNSEAIEIPTEDDGTLTISTVSAQYPDATGLKYHLNGRTRAVRLSDGKLYPPEGGWSQRVYYCIFPRDSTKRKADDLLETSDSKVSKTSGSDSSSSWVHTDLVVLGLPWKTTDEGLRDYFSKYGELQLAQVKLDPLTKKSKGYGFVRFVDPELQVRVMLQRHNIDGRWCDVRVPVSKDCVGKKSPFKVFVGQCSEDLTDDILREYFSQFGEISDLYVPKPSRGFAFVTFTDSNAAKKVCTQEHHIKNTKVHVTEAVPKGGSDKLERGRPAGRGRVSNKNVREDSYSGNNYDEYFDVRNPWNGREDNGWRDERWRDDPGFTSNTWRSKGTNWSDNVMNNKWRNDSDPVSSDSNIDPDLVTAAVNKAVMGLIGNVSGSQVSSASHTAMSGYPPKEEWWNRR